jgi:hypothetical protein
MHASGPQPSFTVLKTIGASSRTAVFGRIPALMSQGFACNSGWYGDQTECGMKIL